MSYRAAPHLLQRPNRNSPHHASLQLSLPPESELDLSATNLSPSKLDLDPLPLLIQGNLGRRPQALGLERRVGEDGTLELEGSGDIENDGRDGVEDAEVDLDRSGERQGLEISLDSEIVVLGTVGAKASSASEPRMQAPLEGERGKDLHDVLAQAVGGRCRGHLG